MRRKKINKFTSKRWFDDDDHNIFSKSKDGTEIIALFDPTILANREQFNSQNFSEEMKKALALIKKWIS